MLTPKDVLAKWYANELLKGLVSPRTKGMHLSMSFAELQQLLSKPLITDNPLFAVEVERKIQEYLKPFIDLCSATTTIAFINKDCKFYELEYLSNSYFNQFKYDVLMSKTSNAAINELVFSFTDAFYSDVINCKHVIKEDLNTVITLYEGRHTQMCNLFLRLYEQFKENS